MNDLCYSKLFNSIGFRCSDELSIKPIHNWEHFSVVDNNLTFYIPVSGNLEGKSVQVMLLTTDRKLQEMKPEVWLCNPNLYEKLELKLE